MPDLLEEVVLTDTRRSFTRGTLVNPGIEIDQFLLNQLDMQTGRLTEVPLGEIPVPGTPDVDVDEAMRDAFARATPNQRSALLAQANAIQDFVDETLAREFRLTGQLSPIAIERYGDYARNAFERFQQFERAAAAAAERAAAAVLPEVLVSAAGSRAVQVLTGTPLGLAGLIVEGLYDASQYFSDLALRNALDRLAPPPAATTQPAEPEPERPPGVIPDSFDPTEVVVSAPRPQPGTLAPPVVGLPVPIVSIPSPLGLTGPTANPEPLPTDVDLATPLQMPGPAATPLPTEFTLADPLRFTDPILTGSIPGGVGSPPRSSDPCNCRPQQPKKRKKKKDPREVCYAGTYIERSKSLSKSPKRKVPCR